MALEADEVVGVPDVRWVRRRFRVALPHQVGVDEPPADIDVCEEPAEAVPRLHVEHEIDPAPVHEADVSFSGDFAIWLSALRGVVDLGCVDPDVPNFLDLIADRDIDRVAVHDARDVSPAGPSAVETALRRRGTAPAP